MGCLVDRYIVKVKPEYKEAHINDIIEDVLPEYHRMLFSLWNEFHDLCEIISSDNFYKAVDIIKEHETDDIIFSHRYRGNCLLKNIREKFFYTIAIIEDEHNWDKFNYYNVIDNDDVIRITVEEKGVTTRERRPIPEDIKEKCITECYGEDITSESGLCEKSFDEWNIDNTTISIVDDVCEYEEKSFIRKFDE